MGNHSLKLNPAANDLFAIECGIAALMMMPYGNDNRENNIVNPIPMKKRIKPRVGIELLFSFAKAVKPREPLKIKTIPQPMINKSGAINMTCKPSTYKPSVSMALQSLPCHSG